MSLATNIYKKQRNIILLLVKKKIDNIKLWSLLALNCLSLSSEEAVKITFSSHKQAAVLNSKVGLGSAMKKRDTVGLYKIWMHNHTVVTLKCEVNRLETTKTFIF